MNESLYTIPFSPIAPIMAIGLGVYAIHAARRLYTRPDTFVARWPRVLPQKPWAWRLVRGSACFFMWVGCLIVGGTFQSLLDLPAGGWPFLVIALGAAASTFALIPRKVRSVETITILKKHWR
jgi:hypothetical protein